MDINGLHPAFSSRDYAGQDTNGKALRALLELAFRVVRTRNLVNAPLATVQPVTGTVNDSISRKRKLRISEQLGRTARRVLAGELGRRLLTCERFHHQNPKISLYARADADAHARTHTRYGRV